MKNELKIKPASEYAAGEIAAQAAIDNILHDKAIAFINEVVVPELDDRMAHPEKYTSTGGTSFPSPHYPAHEFVEEVAKLLQPLGFQVSESHDGGGMYATVVIRWNVPAPILDTSCS
jgi:hypothetical protein